MRLIDADDLDFTFDRRFYSRGDEQYVRGVDDAINVVRGAPTFEAVPVVQGSPCDLCRYAPPSSFDGKPCAMCPAEAKIWGNTDGSE